MNAVALIVSGVALTVAAFAAYLAWAWIRLIRGERSSDPNGSVRALLRRQRRERSAAAKRGAATRAAREAARRRAHRAEWEGR